MTQLHGCSASAADHIVDNVGIGVTSIPIVACVVAAVAAEPDFSVFDYAVELSVDREHKVVTGRETLRVRSAAGWLTTVEFPRNGLEIRSITSERGEPIPNQVDADRIRIRPLTALGRGQTATFVIDYVARAPKGVVFQADAVYSVFHTCHWMVCREGPGDKATVSLAMDVPEGFTLIANGAPVVLPGSSGRKPQLWRDSVPTSPYLFGFALGKFTRTKRIHRGVTLDYFVSTNDAGGDQAAWREHAFADDDKMLDFFVAKAGRPLPRPYYRQVVVAGSAAQELSSFSILGREELDVRTTNPQEDWLVAHEMAHQFWGNLVTCADWSHFWLNEGLTVFMVAAYKEQRWGRAAYEHELDLLRARHQIAIEAHFDVPLTFAGVYPSLKLKRAITYSKAALFLARLRAVMGERAFWSALAKYTRTFAARTATTQDFQRVFAAETPRELGPLFAAWAYENHASPSQ